jgi:hypothetical protein
MNEEEDMARQRLELTQAKWLASQDVEVLLAHHHGQVSARKVRLFACACCRCVPGILADERSARAIEVAERLADGRETVLDRQSIDADWQLPRNPAWVVSWAERADSAPGGLRAALWARERGATGLAEAAREVFGNPFRPIVIEPAVLAWSDGTVRKMARTIYEERRLSDLPILADALEEAGCGSTELLEHLRGPEAHRLGCWALDRVLGRA